MITMFFCRVSLSITQDWRRHNVDRAFRKETNISISSGWFQNFSTGPGWSILILSLSVTTLSKLTKDWPHSWVLDLPVRLCCSCVSGAGGAAPQEQLLKSELPGWIRAELAAAWIRFYPCLTCTPVASGMGKLVTQTWTHQPACFQVRPLSRLFRHGLTSSFPNSCAALGSDARISQTGLADLVWSQYIIRV